MQNSQDVQLATASLLEYLPSDFRESAKNVCGVILGTGLGKAVETLAKSPDARVIPWDKVKGFPKSHVPSHKGVFVYGHLGGAKVLAQSGRIHLYEGFKPSEICMGVRIMALCGIKTLVITNAAGALNPVFEAGTLMCMNDMINHTGVSPLTGLNSPDMFLDLSEPFDPDLQDMAMTSALELGIRLEKGVYIGVHGPEMETPAETRMYRQWGADAIGMSSVLEIIAARYLGLSVLGISCLTNKNLPDCMKPAPIEEVIDVANKTSSSLVSLLESFLQKWNKTKSPECFRQYV